jgi:hypothetical protein
MSVQKYRKSPFFLGYFFYQKSKFQSTINQGLELENEIFLLHLDEVDMSQENTKIKAVLNKDIFLGFFLFFFFVIMFYESHRIVSLTVSDVGGDFFPKIVSAFGSMLSVFIFLGGIQVARMKKRLPQQIEKIPDEMTADRIKKRGDSFVSIISLGLILLYMIFFQLLGFILSSSLYVLAQTFILIPDERKRNIKKSIAILWVAGFIPAIVFIFFRYFFNLMLPVGFIFY